VFIPEKFLVPAKNPEPVPATPSPLSPRIAEEFTHPARDVPFRPGTRTPPPDEVNPAGAVLAPVKCVISDTRR